MCRAVRVTRGGSTLHHTILGMAGPMSLPDAEHFVQSWKHPKTSDRIKFREWKRCDPDRGVVLCGRMLASRAHNNWEEYWPFLDRLCDITSPAGLLGIENTLRKNSTAREGGGFLGGAAPDLNDIDAFVAVVDLPSFAWCKNLQCDHGASAEDNNPADASVGADVDALGRNLQLLSLAAPTMNSLDSQLDAMSVTTERRNEDGSENDDGSARTSIDVPTVDMTPDASAVGTTSASAGIELTVTRAWVQRMHKLLQNESHTCNLPPTVSADKRFAVCASLLKSRIRKHQHVASKRGGGYGNAPKHGAASGGSGGGDEGVADGVGTTVGTRKPTLADSPLSPGGRRARARRDGVPSTPPTTPAHGVETQAGQCSPLSVCARLGVCGHSSICRSPMRTQATVASPLAVAPRNTADVQMRLDFR